MPNYTYTYPNTNLQSITGAQIQNPYGNSNMLMNLPYNNGSSYMAQGSNSPNQFLKCRPVSSKDEARAYQIDLDGSLWVFTDVGNGKIYTKQVNNDGTATFKTYAFTQDENPYASTYVTKEEFNKVIQTLMATIQSNGSQESMGMNKSSEPIMNF